MAVKMPYKLWPIASLYLAWFVDRFYKLLLQYILDGIKWNIVVFRIFALRYNISNHSLPQDGRHPEKSPGNNDLQVK